MSSMLQRFYPSVVPNLDTCITGGQLLDTFVKRQDEAAFEALMKLHGRMVLGVCRRILGNYHDAEEAFQATFLILSRKAASITQRNQVGSWLYRVACRIALRSHRLKKSRRTHEIQIANVPEPTMLPMTHWIELTPVVNREVNSLPEKYRVPVVLCDIEGRSRKDVAHALGCPQGTIATRLKFARSLLAKRLSQQGFA